MTGVSFKQSDHRRNGEMSAKTNNGLHRRCPVCGRGTLERRLISENFEYRDAGDVGVVSTVDVPIEDCTICGESFSGPDAARIRHQAIGRALGLLQPQEIRTIRERIGQSLDQFGKLLGVTSERLSQWENGMVWQDRTADRLMRLLVKLDNVQCLQGFQGDDRCWLTRFSSH
jgi:HTH-type transcriptional regulator / antitoxin MqsA